MQLAGGSLTERDETVVDAPEAVPATAQARASWGYRPGLDGLRAVAVIAVVLYHNGFRSVPGGYLGVDVFFALSGFLITSLLLDEYDRHGRIRLVEFWARRFRRLLPALLLLMVGVWLYLQFGESVLVIPSRRDDVPWVLTYLTNWRFISSHASYFEAFTAPSPFRHLWSLAIEEQLYLLWPPVLAFTLWLRKGRSDLLLATAAVLAVGSAVLMAVLIPAIGDPTRSYYGTDTRAQTVLIGAVAAILLRGRTLSPVWRRAIAVAGFAAGVLMLACFALIQDTNLQMYQGGFLIFALIATVVVVDAAYVGSPVSSVLSLRPLRWIGGISYGIYLWHWPINLYINPVRYNLPFAVIFVVRCLLTVGVAWLSFHLVERPVRRWLEARGGRGGEPRRSRSPWITIGAAAAAIALAAFVFVQATTVSMSGGDVRLTLRHAVQHKVRPSTIDLPAGYNIYQPLRLTIVGDSTGFSLAEPKLLNGVSFVNGSILGCGATTGDYYYGDFLRALPDQCSSVQRLWAGIARQPTRAILVFLGGWEVFDPRVDGRRLSVTSDAWHDWFVKELRQRVDALVRSSSGKVPVALVELPCPSTDTMNIGQGAWEREDPARVAAVNRAVRELAADMGSPVRTVSYAGVVCDANGRYVQRDADGVQARPDGLHADGHSRVRIWQSLIDQLHLPARSS